MVSPNAHNARILRVEGVATLPEYVFTTSEGRPMDMNKYRNRQFRRACDMAHIHPYPRFHDCRHTFASILLNNGESLKYVQEALGHSSIKMTADVYSHLIPGANRQAVDKLPGIEVLKQVAI